MNIQRIFLEAALCAASRQPQIDKRTINRIAT
jgi:hypothetical protein